MVRDEALSRRGLPNAATIWLTGLPAAGKTTLAVALQAALRDAGEAACLLDGDALRQGLSMDLSLSPEDRSEQARRVAHVAVLIAQSNIFAIVALVSPYLRDRERARDLHRDARLPFVEVYVDTPLAVCELRDPKRLYARARAHGPKLMTGLDGPYEPPAAPEVHIRGDVQAPDLAAQAIVDRLQDLPVSDEARASSLSIGARPDPRVERGMAHL